MTATQVALVRVERPDDTKLKRIIALGEQGLVEVLHVPMIGFCLVVAVQEGDGVRFYNLGPIEAVNCENVSNYEVSTFQMRSLLELVDPLKVYVNPEVTVPFPWGTRFWEE